MSDKAKSPFDISDKGITRVGGTNPPEIGKHTNVKRIRRQSAPTVLSGNAPPDIKPSGVTKLSKTDLTPID